MSKFPAFPSFAFLCASVMPALTSAQDADSPSTPRNLVERPAVFTVTTDVVNPALEPFTITASGFGNSLKRPAKGGFEPISFRNQYSAAQASPDRIYVGGGGGLSHYDSFASGFLDDAEVRVYRVVNGQLKLVRTDVIPKGGSVIEEWFQVSTVIHPESTKGQFRWDDWSRPDSERWFTVFALNANGEPSKAGETIKLTYVKPERGSKAENKTTDFRAPRGRASSAALVEPPANVKATAGADGIVHLTWNPSPSTGVVGYKIAYTDTDPAKHRGSYLQLSRQPATPEESIRQRDMIIVAKEMAPFRPEYLSHRVGALNDFITGYMPVGVPNNLMFDSKSWRLAPHAKDTPVEEPGKTYFELTVQAGESQKVGRSGIPDISHTGQSFYPTPDRTEYTMEVWMKADREDAPPVVFEYDGDRNIGGFLQPHPIKVGTTWKKYVHKFMGEPAERGFHAYFVLTASGPATYSFDNFRVFRSDTAHLDYEKRDYDRLRDSGMMAYRTHHPIKTGRASYSMEHYLGFNGSVETVIKGTSLGGVFSMLTKAKMHPWLQIEFHMSPDEWLGFAEFMAAPYDPKKDTPQSKPWAHMRYEQGRAEPWTDGFERIYFELANETWNSLFAPWTFQAMPDSATGANVARGKVYGLMHDHVVGILRSSPYWTKEIDAKFIHVMGGWAINSYNSEIASATKTGEFITIAAYNGGWDAGEGPPGLTPASFLNVLNFANQSAIPGAQGLLADAIKWESQTGRHFKIGTYEAGPGYALNGLNNIRVTPTQAADQEKVMKSKAAGVATLDTFLSQAIYDFDIQNFFTFSEGAYWTSHARPWSGGYAHPSFLYLSLFNHEGLGDLLRVSTDSVPTVDLPNFRRRQAVNGAPSVAAYATRRGDRVNLVIISRRYPDYPVGSGTGHVPFGVTLPFTKANKITLHRLTGEPDDTNLDGEKVRLEQVSVPPSALKPGGRFIVSPETGGDARGLPPAEAFLYVFEGTDIAPSKKTLSREEITRLPTTFTDKR